MREIKFRGLDLNSRKWVYGYYDYKWGNNRISNNDGFEFVDGETVGQYTGLKDSNGKEIYEGDIIQYNGDYKFKSKVIFKDGEFLLDNGITSVYFSVKSIENTGEIIGNIHENPELVED